MRSKISKTFLGNPTSGRLLAELRRRLNPDLRTIQLFAAPPEFGYVYGGGQYRLGDIIDIGAVPYRGYEFVEWSDRVIDAVRRITVRQNKELSAYFRPDITGTIEFNSCYR